MPQLVSYDVYARDVKIGDDIYSIEGKHFGVVKGKKTKRVWAEFSIDGIEHAVRFKLDEQMYVQREEMTDEEKLQVKLETTLRMIVHGIEESEAAMNAAQAALIAHLGSHTSFHASDYAKFVRAQKTYLLWHDVQRTAEHVRDDDDGAGTTVGLLEALDIVRDEQTRWLLSETFTSVSTSVMQNAARMEEHDAVASWLRKVRFWTV